jgi:hypothetical protein
VGEEEPGKNKRKKQRNKQRKKLRKKQRKKQRKTQRDKGKKERCFRAAVVRLVSSAAASDCGLLGVAILLPRRVGLPFRGAAW